MLRLSPALSAVKIECFITPLRQGFRRLAWFCYTLNSENKRSFRHGLAIVRDKVRYLLGETWDNLHAKSAEYIIRILNVAKYPNEDIKDRY